MTRQEYAEKDEALRTLMAVRALEIREQCELEFANQICLGSKAVREAMDVQREMAKSEKIARLIEREQTMTEIKIFGAGGRVQASRSVTGELSSFLSSFNQPSKWKA